MQTAGAILASPLPRIRQVRGTSHPSLSHESLNPSFLHQWTTFGQEIRSALASLDLNFQVAHVDFPEVYLVGNEIGLSGRFVNNVCQPVAKVLTHQSQPSLVIGDIQAFQVPTSDVVPDVAIGVTLFSDINDTSVKIVGEFKTFWTVMLNEFAPSNPMTLDPFLPHFGMCNERSAVYYH